tara:strand:+ start:222 stop:419 length:198 start_codon:yes stop_codon:yes gene_type:complete
LAKLAAALFGIFANFKKRNLFFNMNNLISNDFLQAMQIIGVFIGLYAIIFGLLLGTDWPKLKKQK